MLLEIKELSVKVKSSGVKVVNGINLSVDEGEQIGRASCRERV